MYIGQVIKKTQELLEKNPTNLVMFSLSFIIVWGVIGLLFAVIYLGFYGLYFTSLLGLLIGLMQSELYYFLVTAAGIVGTIFLLILLLISAYLGALSMVFSLRCAYLTFLGKSIPITVEQVKEIYSYSKENLFKFLKIYALFFLALISLVIVLGIIAFAVYFISMNILVKLVVYICIAIIALIVMYLLGHTFSNATYLFFMGNENIGTRKLVQYSTSLFFSNFFEYVLFDLAYLLITICFGIIYLAVSCFGLIAHILYFLFLMAVFVAFFVFLDLLAKSKEI